MEAVITGRKRLPILVNITDGYELTSNREVEADFEKIAIYVDLADMLPGHVARADGRCWKSKLGARPTRGNDLLDGDGWNRGCEF